MSIISAILIFVGLSVGFLFYQSVSLKRKLFNAFNSTFDIATYKPTYMLSWSYGRPFFTITFNSEEDLECAKAEGLTKVFLKKYKIYVEVLVAKKTRLKRNLQYCTHQKSSC